MKKLGELTLKEYNEYKELLNSEHFNIFEIMNLLGIKDPDKLELVEFNNITNMIVSESINIPPIKKLYLVNGRYFKPVLMVKDIKAAQFTDFQAFMSGEYKLNRVLSVFLLPVDVKKNIFKKTVYKAKNYNEGYDVLEVQNFLYNNFNIQDALALSSFFLNLSARLLPLTLGYLNRKMMKMMVKQKKQMKQK